MGVTKKLRRKEQRLKRLAKQNMYILRKSEAQDNRFALRYAFNNEIVEGFGFDVNCSELTLEEAERILETIQSENETRRKIEMEKSKELEANIRKAIDFTNPTKPNIDEHIKGLKEVIDNFILDGEWYEHYDDGCPYDHSGDTRHLTISKIDYIKGLEPFDDSDVGISNFRPLEEIYMGGWKPSHYSRHGKLHITAQDALSEEFEECVCNDFIDINMPHHFSNDTDEYNNIKSELSELFYDEYIYEYFYNIFEEVIQLYTKEKILRLLESA